MEDIIMLQETKATQQNNKEYYVRMIEEMLSQMDDVKAINRVFNFVQRLWIHSK